MRTLSLSAFAAALLAGLTFIAAPASADKPQNEKTAARDSNANANANARRTAKSKGKTPDRRRLQQELTPEREAAANTFVKQHHPSLALLLVELKKTNSREYQRAMRDLFRTSERLANMRDIDMERYDLEISLWKTQSRVQLLVARLRMSPAGSHDALRAELAAELKRQSEVRVAILKRERAKIVQRLNKVDEQINSYTSGRDDFVQKQLRLLDRTNQRPKKAAVKTRNQ